MGIKVTAKKLKDKKDKKFMRDKDATMTKQDEAMKAPPKQKPSTTRKYKGGFMGKGSGRATRGY